LTNSANLLIENYNLVDPFNEKKPTGCSHHHNHKRQINNKASRNDYKHTLSSSSMTKTGSTSKLTLENKSATTSEMPSLTNDEELQQHQHQQRRGQSIPPIKSSKNLVISISLKSKFKNFI
jgi:hypothetical protein